MTLMPRFQTNCLLVIALLVSCNAWASAEAEGRQESTASESANQRTRTISLASKDGAHLNDAVRPLIADSYRFSGLATYYNTLDVFFSDGDGLSSGEAGESRTLSREQWFVARGRFNVFALQAAGATVHIEEDSFQVELPPRGSESSVAVVVSKPDLGTIAPELDDVRYGHLGFLNRLARLMESAIVEVHRAGVASWGLSILVFGVLLKLLLLPVGILTVRFQSRVSQVSSKLAPRLAAIKENYDGEEAHDRVMAAHRELGVSPFYTMKPLLGSLIQVPVQVAVFNVLGPMPQLQGQGFLWISDLAYPDSIAILPWSIPMLGDQLSLLPFLMTAVPVVSTLLFRNQHATPSEMRSQKRNLYLMTAAFFVLFYPFPAAMVLYWTWANILQTGQQRFVRA